MIEMHGRYVVDMRSREGFYAESFYVFTYGKTCTSNYTTIWFRIVTN